MQIDYGSFGLKGKEERRNKRTVDKKLPKNGKGTVFAGEGCSLSPLPLLRPWRENYSLASALLLFYVSCVCATAILCIVLVIARGTEFHTSRLHFPIFAQLCRRLLRYFRRGRLI